MSPSAGQPRQSAIFLSLALLALVVSSLAEPVPKSSYRFDFGGKAASGYTAVGANTMYNEDRGYGFEPGSSVISVVRGGNDRLRDGFVTSDQVFYFSAAVPGGNYRVTLTLGDRAGTSQTTVKAELRRLMINRVETHQGSFETRAIIVNARRPGIAVGTTVKLKEREKTSEAWAWDNKLTLEFSGKQPKLCALTIEKADDVPTIYIAGDSTSTDQPAEPYNSWGQMITAFFKPEISVANNGESGETARSFVAENRWLKVLSVIKPGDYVFIQFGHNDQKEKGPSVGAYGSYSEELTRFVKDAREGGATPVLITSMHRLTFGPDKTITNSLGDFPEAVRRVAREQGVALIDLNAMSKRLYEALGPDNAHLLFAGEDKTHHSDYGSYELAKCVVQGIREAHLLLEKRLAAGLRTFDPSHPDAYADFDVPPDPGFSEAKPYGK